MFLFTFQTLMSKNSFIKKSTNFFSFQVGITRKYIVGKKTGAYLDFTDFT